MRLPIINEIPQDAEVISSFGGLDKGIQISDNLFSDMTNMTGDFYPMAASRQSRGGVDLPGGVFAMQMCNTYGTREDAAQGAVREDVFAIVTSDQNGEAFLELRDSNGEEAKAPFMLGGSAKDTTLICRAGYVYAFPQGVRRATYEGENGSLSNTTITRRMFAHDEALIPGGAYFEMRPCDSEGIVDGGPIASRAATKLFDGTDPSVSRQYGDLIIVRASGLAVNEFGTTVKVSSEGKVLEKYYGVAETIEIPAGGFALTANGDSASWLSNNAKEGRFISISGMKLSIFETADSSVVFEKPDSPFNGQKWYDRATSKKYVYSTAQGEWMPYTLNYIFFTFEPGVGDSAYLYDVLHNGKIDLKLDGTEALLPFEGFKEGDAIKIKGFSEELDGSYIIEKVAGGGLVLRGVIFDSAVKMLSDVDDEEYSKAVTVSRALPKMDYVIESGNRLWGCYYGIGEDGKVINEIYASALGDPTNWCKYQGISTDSWTATIGADGPFTGAIQYGGYPLFFKENAIIRVYGTAPSSFSTAEYNYRGVQKGSHRSLSVCDEVLYYLSDDGVMAYNGSVPRKVSDALGRERYKSGVAGAISSKYYLSCLDASENCHLFVFDASLGVWHREDELRVDQFLRHKTQLYMLTGGEVKTVYGSGETVEFEATTGEWGLSDPIRKYFSRFLIRADVPFGAELEAFVSYDGGDFSSIKSFRRGDFEVYELSGIPRDCDKIRLKFKGRGPVKISYIFREVSEGGENIF